MEINELSELFKTLCQILNDIFIKTMLFYSSTVQEIKLYIFSCILPFSTFMNNPVKSSQNHRDKEVENKTFIHSSPQRTIQYCSVGSN